MRSTEFGQTANRPTVLVGTSAVALVLGASRWGTNLGSSPLFLTDVLILLGLIGWFLATMTQGSRPLTGYVPQRRPSTLFVFLFAFVVIRALTSVSNGPLLDWIRDAAPFLYGFLAFVAAHSFARAPAEVRAKTMRVFWYALVFHLVWMIFVTLTGTRGFATPLGSAGIFEMRPDIDAALLGVGAGIFLLRAFREPKKFWPIFATISSVACVLLMNSRAALISVALSLGLAYLLHYSTTRGKTMIRSFMQLAVPIVLLFGLISLPLTAPGQRILATIDRSQTGTVGQVNAQGTERARQLVWSGVVEWTNKEGSRQLFGSGFGNDFLTESGTLQYLEGTTYENVRSPHNWFVGVYARMGLVGLALAVAVCAQLLVTILRHRKRIAADPLLSLTALITVAILPVATLGVVLESPFGAVPFWWAAGILFTLRKAGTLDLGSKSLLSSANDSREVASRGERAASRPNGTSTSRRHVGAPTSLQQ